MIFSSLFFLLVFLPISLAAYYLFPTGKRNLSLLISSLVFYAWGEPVDIFLMILTILFDYVAGILLEYYLDRPLLKKAVLTVSICGNLALLCYFKYATLFLTTLSALSLKGLSVPEIALPIGISFYTFESISYSVDIYEGKARAQRNLIDFGTYLSFYPHLISGPIIQYRDIEMQLAVRSETLEQMTSGAFRFLTGLFKKVLLANNLSQIADKIQYFGNPSMLSAWMGALAFTFQIYFDFSGYSDMAIGLGRMFGFRLPENFNRPYISQSATEFWRRWHMTLGRWFRDYLYIPLGGNRCSTGKMIRNLAIVWVLTGFWHGASWNFALWGAYWGLLVTLEKLFFQRVLNRIPAFFRWFYAFLAAVVGWVLFFYQDLGNACRMLAAMFGCSMAADPLGVYTFLTGAPILAFAALFCTKWPQRIWEMLSQKGKAGLTLQMFSMTLLLLLSIASLVDNSYNPFLYFRF